MAKNKDLKYKPFEAVKFPLGEMQSNGTRKKTGKQCYGTFWSSMAESEKFNSLTKNQRLLYLYCKLQLVYQNRTKDEIEMFGDTFFTFERDKWLNKYKLYSVQNQNQFYKDMKALIDNGFIILIASGKKNHTKNIYDFSSKWHN